MRRIFTRRRIDARERIFTIGLTAAVTAGLLVAISAIMSSHLAPPCASAARWNGKGASLPADMIIEDRDTGSGHVHVGREGRFAPPADSGAS